MTDDLVKFQLPADFVTARVRLRPSEIAYGYENGWLTDEAVVRVATHLFAEGDPLPPALEGLALLLSDEYAKVREMVAQIVPDPATDPADVWFYLALDWLYEHREEFSNPFEVLEMISADFEFPADSWAMMRFMPAEEGAPTGLDAIERRWRDYLVNEAAKYSARRTMPGAHEDRG